MSLWTTYLCVAYTQQSSPPPHAHRSAPRFLLPEMSSGIGVLKTADGRAAKLLQVAFGSRPKSSHRQGRAGGDGGGGSLRQVRRGERSVKKEVFWVVDELLRRGVPVAERTFTSAIAIVARQGDPDAARALFSKMQRAGVYPDAYAHDAVLAACAAHPGRFLLELRRKRAAGLPVTAQETFAHLRSLAHRKAADPASRVDGEAAAAVEQATRAGVALDVFHYAKLVQCCEGVAQVDACLVAMPMQADAGVALAAMKVAARAGDAERARAYRRDLLLRGGPGSGETLGHVRELARALRRAGKPVEADAEWQRAEGQGLVRDAGGYASHDAFERFATLRAVEEQRAGAAKGLGGGRASGGGVARAGGGGGGGGGGDSVVRKMLAICERTSLSLPEEAGSEALRLLTTLAPSAAVHAAADSVKEMVECGGARVPSDRFHVLHHSVKKRQAATLGCGGDSAAVFDAVELPEGISPIVQETQHADLEVELAGRRAGWSTSADWESAGCGEDDGEEAVAASASLVEANPVEREEAEVWPDRGKADALSSPDALRAAMGASKLF